MRETVSITMTTTTSIEHNSHGKLSSCYTTTIPLDVPLSSARAIIRRIAAVIAKWINEDFREETGQDNTSTYILTSVTKDFGANRYCFAVEYSENVIYFVERYIETDIEVEI